jgi:MFS family permease
MVFTQKTTFSRYPILFPVLLLASCSAFTPTPRTHSLTHRLTTAPLGLPSRTIVCPTRIMKSDTDSRKTSRRNTASKARKEDDAADEDNSPEKAMGVSSSWPISLVLPLWLVYTSNQWSRSSIYFLVDFSSDANPFQAMNLDIGFSEAQYGVLASVAFTSLFAVASLGAGVASDRYNRKALTLASATAWSVATLGTAFSDSYTQVVICRVLMGLACAFSTPTAYTLIRDAVPKDRVALASSLYATAVALGSGLASLSILLDQELGWRNALEVISLFGAISVAASVLLLPDDPKDSAPALLEEGSDAETPSITADIFETVSTSRVQWLFLASFLRFCSGLCIGVWSAPYFRMVFADQQADYAIAQAGISAIGASASGLLGGAAADWLSSTTAPENPDKEGRKLLVPVVGSLLAAPAFYFAVHSEQSFEVSMYWLAAEYFVAECWFGPTITTLQATVAPRIGGTAQGLFTLTGAIANFAPSILGYFYGQQVTEAGESATELSSLLGAGVCFGYLSCAFCFAMAANSPPPILADKAKEL